MQHGAFLPTFSPAIDTSNLPKYVQLLVHQVYICTHFHVLFAGFLVINQNSHLVLKKSRLGNPSSW